MSGKWSDEDHRWEYEQQGLIAKEVLADEQTGPIDWRDLSVTAIAAENASVSEYIATLEARLAAEKERADVAEAEFNRLDAGDQLSIGEVVMDELKPCPFCGCAAAIAEDPYCFNGHTTEGFRVECLGECHGMTCWWHTREQAVAAWNRRQNNVR